MSIRVELELDSGDFEAGIVRARSSLQTLNQGLNGTITGIRATGAASQGFLSNMRDLAVVVGAVSVAMHSLSGVFGGIVSSIVGANSAMERTTTLLKSMATSTDSAKEAANNVAYLRNMALSAPYSLSALSEAFVRMKSTGIDPTKGSMAALTDAVAAFGGSEDVLKRASVALSQMAGKGVVQMEELRQQLGEAVPRATELMARSMGISYAELTKKVATGTLDAKTSIEALNAEIERTYGGAAAARMNTWDGLISQLQTRWENLSLEVQKSSGFYDNLKNQLRDVIQLMQGSVGTQLAAGVGTALNSVVSYTRSAIEAMVHFRQEILLVGEVFAVAFAGSKIASMFVGLVNWVGQARSAFALMRAELTLFRNASSGLGGLALGIRSISDAAAVASLGVGALRVGVIGLATTLEVVAPWIPILVLSVTGLATAMGLFSNKARDAWQEMEQFGAKTRDQLKLGDEYLKQQEKDLENAKALVEVSLRQDFGSDYETNPHSEAIERARQQALIEADIYNKSKDLEELKAAQVRHNKEVEVEEARAAADKQIGIVNEQLDAAKSLYDKDQIAKGETYVADRKAAEGAGKDTQAIQKKYAAQRIQDVKAYEQQRYDIIKHYLDEAEKLAASGGEAERKRQQGAIDKLRDMAAEAQTRLTNANNTVDIGPVLNAGGNGEQAMSRGQKKLEQLHEAIAGIKEDIAGGATEWGKLQYAIQNGVYGPADAENMKKFKEETEAAAKELDRLRELQKDQQEFERDVQSTLERQAEKLAKLNDKNGGEFGALSAKAAAGGFGLLGSSIDDVAKKNDQLRSGMIEQNGTAVQLGTTIQTNTFGQPTKSAGEQVLDLINRINGAWSNLKGNVNGTNFAGAFGTFGTGGSPTGSAQAVQANLPAYAKAFLEAIAGPESGGRYDVRYSPSGAKTFDPSQGHPRIFEPGPAGPSSAAGKYQITSSTFDSMGGGSFDPASQDVMAWNIAQRDYKAKTGRDLSQDLQSGQIGNVLSTLGSTWAAFKSPGNVNNGVATFNQLMQGGGMSPLLGNTGGSNPLGPFVTQIEQAGTAADKSAKDLQKIKDNDAEIAKAEGAKELSDALSKVSIEAATAEMKVKGVGETEAKLRAIIKSGTRYGTSAADKDPENEKYKAMLETARKVDQAEADFAAKKKARSAAERADDKLTSKQEELNAKRDELARRMKNPLSQKYDDGYIALEASLDKELQAYADLYGKESTQYREHLQQKEALLAQYQQNKAMQEFAKLPEENAQLRRGLMTESQARTAANEEEITRLKNLLETSKLTGEQRVQAEALVQEKIRLLRQQEAASGPLGKQMQEWSKFGENLEQAATGWLDSAADAIGTFVATGKLDFKQLAQSIISDMTKIALKAAIGGMFNKGGSGGGKGKAAAAAGGGSKAGGLFGGIGKMFGFAHTGGILGSSRLRQGFINPVAFAGAPKFHGGGLIQGLGLQPGEVPIIAKKGEGVFTPEQMKAMGGTAMVHAGQQIQVNAPITVNGSAGTPEQNDDLAKKMQVQLERTVRGVVADEMRTQMRTGNMLNRPGMR